MLYCVKKMFLSDQKESSIVSGSRLVENFLITHHPHSRMCIRIYIFNFKNKQTSENKTKNTKKQKKLKKNRDSGKSSKKKFAAARVKIFLITLISGNKNFFTFFLPNINNRYVRKYLMLWKSNILTYTKGTTLMPYTTGIEMNNKSTKLLFDFCHISSICNLTFCQANTIVFCRLALLTPVACLFKDCVFNNDTVRLLQST